MAFASTLNALLFALMGIVLFAVSLVVVARLLPGDLWKQAIVEKNQQAALILLGVALALGWIVAAAVH
jgi:putative membrane protein